MKIARGVAALFLLLVVASFAITLRMPGGAAGEPAETPEPSTQHPSNPPETLFVPPAATESPQETPEPEPEPEEYHDEVTAPDFLGYEYSIHYEYTDEEIDMIAKTVWGEARGCAPEEQRLVVWTILQRVDDPKFPDTIAEVITARNQFAGYEPSYPIWDEIRKLCHEEVEAWSRGAEPPTHTVYAPTAPYLFFDGDGSNNWFREEYSK